MILNHIPSRSADPDQPTSPNNFDRRRLLLAAATAGLSLPFAGGKSEADDARTPDPKHRLEVKTDPTNSLPGARPLGEMAMIRTKQLLIEVRDSGPKTGPVILLVHGWPDDASAWDDIAPVLNDAGFRTIAPMYRGFGRTRFLSAQAQRTGNTGILAVDAIGLMNALSIERFSVAGHDWGSNVTEALAVGWPDRIHRIAMMSTPSRLGGLQTPSFEQARRQWYHWFQVTQRGAIAVRHDPKGFAHIMWKTWSPEGWFEETEFDRVAKSFQNPDWTDVTLHSYSSRWGEAPVDPRSLKLEAKIKATKQLGTPTLFFHGEKDGVTPPSGSEEMGKKFKDFHRFVVEGAGHFLPREAPALLAAELIAHFSLS